MPKQTRKYPLPDDPRLKRVKFVVFDGDPFAFWREYHNLCELKQDQMGITFQYADFGKRKPCWASVFFYDVDGVWTMFVDAHGAYLDHFALEQFVWDMVGQRPTHDNQCDGNNTHNHTAVLAASRERRIAWFKKNIQDKIMELGCFNLDTVASVA